MKANQVEKWLGAQIVNIILDILIIPFVRIFVITSAKTVFGVLDHNYRSDLYIISSASARQRSHALHYTNLQYAEAIPPSALEGCEQKKATKLAFFRIDAVFKEVQDVCTKFYLLNYFLEH